NGCPGFRPGPKCPGEILEESVCPVSHDPAKLKVPIHFSYMGLSLKFCIPLCLLGLQLCLAADNPTPAPETIVDQNCAAALAQEKSLEGASMEVDMDGYLPKLQKRGKLHALRRISPFGLIKYDMLRFEGDRTVNKEIITRYLNAEADNQREHRADTAVSP